MLLKTASFAAVLQLGLSFCVNRHSLKQSEFYVSPEYVHAIQCTASNIIGVGEGAGVGESAGVGEGAVR